MKQIYLSKLLLVATLLLCSLCANAYDFSAENDDGVMMYYNITSSVENNPTVEVTYPNYSLPISINPSEYLGTSYTIPDNVSYGGVTYAVTAIGNRTFYYCSGLTSVTIGENVAAIRDEAFCQCSGLTGELKIPDSVTTIGDEAFYYCTSLTSLTLGNNVTTIVDRAFAHCTGLTSELKIPDSVTSIGTFAFRGCTGLTSMTLSNSLTSIESYVFCECSGLTGELKIPDSVTSIGNSAFHNCSGLTSVTLGNSVDTIDYWAFAKCSSLEKVTIGGSVTKIGDSAFAYCESLKLLDIPNSVTSFGEKVVYGCTSLESLYIGAGLSEISEELECKSTVNDESNMDRYYYCYPILWTKGPSKMKEIVLKDEKKSFSVKGYGETGVNIGYIGGSIREHVFYYGKVDGKPIFSTLNIEYYYVGRPLIDITEWTYTSSYNSQTMEIPFSVKDVTRPYGTIETLEIGGYCTDVPYFYQSIENLILGEGVETYTVKNIYQDELTSITCKSTMPPTLTSTFDTGTYVNTVLYVPIGSKATYQATEGWKDFWDIIEADVSGIDDIVNSGEVTEVGRYTTSGQKIATPQKGINIVHYSDGTTRKILVQ